jgi:conjugative relaxase-like TrwC/TraI family protein
VAWMRMMGADSVAYHRETIIERGDDFPGAALQYYASRGETPLVWGGMGAESLGLVGPVDNPSYDAVFGPGGAIHPQTGERLVTAKRPGMELVISAHKSVAELGVLGRPEDMHAIMDAERDATLSYLDDITQERGGRRGVAALPARTTGLVYAHTRHAVTRAGDPGPHDHVLLANVIEMRDEKGGTKAPDTTLWREHLHAATLVGRLAAASKAVQLGYGIEADPGPTGKLGHWRIQGIPDAALAVHSKRTAEINQAVAKAGFDSYQARQVAARETRKEKRHTPVEHLIPRWRSELSDAGFPIEQLREDIKLAAHAYAWDRHRSTVLSDRQLTKMAETVLGPDGALSQRKVFAKRDVIVATVPQMYGMNPTELPKVIDCVLRDPDAIPLVGVARATEQPFSTASVLATEQAIERAVERGVENLGAARVAPAMADRAITDTEGVIGNYLNEGQQKAVTGIVTSGRGVELVEGVAGSGKTTVMAAVRVAFEEGGFTVIGTSTSGQATRTLGREAGIANARTIASLRWQIEQNRLSLGKEHVLVLDEAGMASDRDTAFLLDTARLRGTKVVMVGDDRQLGAVNVGGALGALVERHGGVVHHLDENVRQHNLQEREALSHLRAGDVARAIEFYAAHDRVVVQETRTEALAQLVNQWALDVTDGRAAAMFAWRRANVAELNRLARERMVADGRVAGPELTAPGGAQYAAGDRIVTLAPSGQGQIVTSERGVVRTVYLEEMTLEVEMEDGRLEQLERDQMGQAQLAHGYATTVHRSQGATTTVAHVFEDGGGRELAYVAMSRARQESHVYVVADDLDQARDDLQRSWETERRWAWAIDTGTPQTADQVGELREPHTGGNERGDPASLRLHALRVEQVALRPAIPTGPVVALRQAEADRRYAKQKLEWFQRDKGSRSEGELSEATWKLIRARQSQFASEQAAANKHLSRSTRRAASRDAAEWEPIIKEAGAEVKRLYASEEQHLSAGLAKAEEKFNSIADQITDRERWFDEHPDVPDRLRDISTDIEGIESQSRREREAVVVELNPDRDRSPKVYRDHGHSRDDYHGYDNDRDLGGGYGL